MRSLSMRKLSNELEARYPGIVIGGVGDAAHQLSPSDHNEDDTAGSKPAQSDPDSIAEHRAIDAMLGPAFTRQQAYAVINEILASPINRQRLFYINFENWQWSRSNNWQVRDNSDDPHPGHAHFSGWASEDGNAAPWLTLSKGDNVQKLVHQEGQGWWISDGINARGIASEEELFELRDTLGLGAVHETADQGRWGIPPKAPAPGGGVSAEQVNDIVRAALIDYAQGGISNIE